MAKGYPVKKAAKKAASPMPPIPKKKTAPKKAC